LAFYIENNYLCNVRDKEKLRQAMKTLLVRTIQWLTLLLSWLTLSPLFCYLSRKWQLIGKKVRMLLLLISPLMLIVYAVAVLFIIQGYNNYRIKHHFASNEVIERITGVSFPELSIIDYEKGNAGFLGDYNDMLTLEMENDLSESTYHYLDSVISVGNTNWHKRNDEYIYGTVWGNGLPAPEGENEEEDIMFSLSFKAGSKMVTLNYGAW
jgi:hypothetical protein